MKKPTEKIRKYLDYFECAKYIAHKLGIKDLRDVDGKWSGNDKATYKDFWHFMADVNSLNNGCLAHVPEPDDSYKDWQNKICQAFHDEFGHVEYWVEW